MALIERCKDHGHKVCGCGGYPYSHRPGSPYCEQNAMSAVRIAARQEGITLAELQEIEVDCAWEKAGRPFTTGRGRGVTYRRAQRTRRACRRFPTGAGRPAGVCGVCSFLACSSFSVLRECEILATTNKPHNHPSVNAKKLLRATGARRGTPGVTHQERGAAVEDTMSHGFTPPANTDFTG